MNRSKRARGEVSRERILQVAAELFAARGYVGAGVDEVAARAEIAKTAIYYHFGNKEGLLAAVLERLTTEWIERIRDVSLEVKDPLARLDRALAGMRAMVEERPWILRLLCIMALEVVEQMPEVRKTLLSLSSLARRTIVDGINDALGMSVPDADTVARMLIALLSALPAGMQIEPSATTLDSFFYELRRIVIFMIVVRINPEIIPMLESGVLGTRQISPNQVG